MKLRVRSGNGRTITLAVTGAETGMQAAAMAAYELGHQVFEASWCLALPTEGEDGVEFTSWWPSDKRVEELAAANAVVAVLSVLPSRRATWN